jgi:putative DNA primase/helicase
VQAIKPPLIAPKAENIPAALDIRPQWIVWRLELRGEKWTKVPYTPGTDSRASATNLLSWRSLEEAVAAYEAGGYDGIGFVFCSGDPYVGVDLDGCRDPETGAIEPWAQKVMDGFESAHVEVSPSGTGVHIIAVGTLDECIKAGPVEMYDQKRFFTITGVAP